MAPRRLASILLMFSCVCAASDHELSIGPSRQTIKSGTEASIVIHLTNRSDQALDLSANISDLTGVDPNFDYDVRDSTGHSAPLRKYKNAELTGGHAMFQTLRPGETITLNEPIGRLFDMSQPRKYTVQVSRKALGEKKGPPVESNKIEIVVTP